MKVVCKVEYFATDLLALDRFAVRMVGVADQVVDFKVVPTSLKAGTDEDIAKQMERHERKQSMRKAKPKSSEPFLGDRRKARWR